MDHITVLDSIMGSGKTTFIIEMLKTAQEYDQGRSFIVDGFTPRKFIVVVPYLTEATRYKSACPTLNFREPKQEGGRKLNGLLSLVQQEANIITTHSLFLNMSLSVAKSIRRAEYELIVDETPQVIELSDALSQHDLDLLLSQGLTTIDQTNGRLIWNDNDNGYTGKFTELKQNCVDGYITVSGDKRTVFDVFPSSFFRVFDKVMVCTYLFKGSVFDAYCQAEGLTVEHMILSVDQQLKPYLGVEHEVGMKARLKTLLVIHEGARNKLGKPSGKRQPLSSSWFSKAKPEELNALKTSTETFFDREAGTSSADSGWTTYKAYKGALSGKGYTRGFIPANARATNDFAHKAAMAFLCNWFEHPSIVRFFKRKGIDVDQDQIALSTLLQWIWRSRIRQGQTVKLFIPSTRMRSLLQQWLEDGGERTDRLGFANRTDTREAA